MKLNMEYIYSDTIGTMIPKYVTSAKPSDIRDGVAVYEWIESEAAYVNGAEDIIFYDDVYDAMYFRFGKEF